jgi:hypothetical protein
MGAIQRKLEENGLLQKHVEFLLPLSLFSVIVLLSQALKSADYFIRDGQLLIIRGHDAKKENSWERNTLWKTGWSC